MLKGLADVLGMGMQPVAVTGLHACTSTCVCLVLAAILASAVK
jgi:hypothetical protein